MVCLMSIRQGTLQEGHETEEHLLLPCNCPPASHFGEYDCKHGFRYSILVLELSKIHHQIEQTVISVISFCNRTQETGLDNIVQTELGWF